MLVLESGNTDLLLLLRLGRGHSAVGNIGVGLPVEIEPHQEYVHAVVGDGHILLVVAILLRHGQLGSVQHDGGAYTVKEVIVLPGHVAAIVIDEVYILNYHILRIPIFRIRYIGNRVFIRYIRAQIGAAVCDMILVCAIHIAGGGHIRIILRDAKYTALRHIVGPAHGDKRRLRHHGHKIGAFLRQGVLQGIVIQRLDANGGKIRGLTTEVFRHAYHKAVEVLNSTSTCIRQMLSGSHPVIGHQIRNLSALGIRPNHTLPNVEGVGQAILRDIIAGGQPGNQLSLAVVLV